MTYIEALDVQQGRIQSLKEGGVPWLKTKKGGKVTNSCQIYYNR